MFACEGADLEMTVAFRDVIKSRYAIDVDDVLRRDKSQFHHRYEALSAGEQLGVGSVFLQ